MFDQIKSFVRSNQVKYGDKYQPLGLEVIQTAIYRYLFKEQKPVKLYKGDVVEVVPQHFTRAARLSDKRKK
jgi:hypothetical protein